MMAKSRRLIHTGYRSWDMWLTSRGIECLSLVKSSELLKIELVSFVGKELHVLTVYLQNLKATIWFSAGNSLDWPYEGIRCRT